MPFKSTKLSDRLEDGMLGLKGIRGFEDVNDVQNALNFIDSNSLKLNEISTELLKIYSNKDGSKKAAIVYNESDIPEEGAIYNKK